MKGYMIQAIVSDEDQFHFFDEVDEILTGPGNQPEDIVELPSNSMSNTRIDATLLDLDPCIYEAGPSQVDLVQHGRAAIETSDIHQQYQKSYELTETLCCPTFNRNPDTRKNADNNVGISLDGGKFSCKLCNKAYSSKGNLVRHEKSYHKGEKSHLCGQCGKHFRDKYTLNVHSSRKHGKNIKVENSNTRARQSQHSEISRDLSDEIFSCKFCSMRLMGEMNLARHLTDNHIRDRSYLVFTPLVVDDKARKHFTCRICGKVYKQSASFYAHFKKHKEKGDCPESTSDVRDALGQSSPNFVEEQPGENCCYACSICGTEFARKNSLVNHLRSHAMRESLLCHVCNKKFTTRYNLITHMRSHTNERPYSCDVCGRRFAQMGNLKRHKNRRHKASSCQTRPGGSAQESGSMGCQATHESDNVVPNTVQCSSSSGPLTKEQEQHELNDCAPSGAVTLLGKIPTFV
ncbi:hypothetical protein QAD02_015593 [Eretmocerus hayati]|uniref:Uncharacterized protein n=1 Tax=Eretmocerus hayati TaxID=131215 RepID=A0ACC2P8P1_9HYME|nr:hypothetical protein QAD02_015593 [Eretmocerus hayati]